MTTKLEFRMPKMGESITEGTIIEWRVKEGETFSEGDILLEVATDKVDNEVPAPTTGKLLSRNYENGDVVPIGEIIAVLEASDALSETGELQKKPHEPEYEQKEIKRPVGRPAKYPGQVAEASSGTMTEERNSKFLSPLILSIAKKNHVSFEELARIPGEGKNGRLRKSDVINYIKSGRPYKFTQPVAPASNFNVPDLKFEKGKGRIIEMDRMRQMIADHMVFSKHTSPHVTAYVEADLTEMVNWRDKNKEGFQKKFGEKLTFTPLFVECVVNAIQEFPMINSSLDGKNIIVKDEINIGLATALPSGNLIVPVVKHADSMDLKGLARATNELVEKARKNLLKPDDTKGSTFTISNVGTFGSLMGTPIINQPEAAILATGIIKKRAEVMEREEGDTIEIRQMMYLSLSFDHRIVDGFLAGSFLKRIADNMEQFDTSRTF